MISLRGARHLSLLLLLTALGGCLGLAREYPEKRYYVIAAERMAPATTTLPASLRVQTLRIAPAYDHRQLVYRRGESEYESDYYHEHFVTPAEQASEELHNWLQRSRAFANVQRQSALLASDYILGGSIDALYGDYRDRETPQAVLELSFFLLADGDAEPRSIFEWRAAEAVPLEEETPLALVNGWSLGLSRVLAALEPRLVAAVQAEVAGAAGQDR